ELARVALVVESTQSVEALVAIDPEPFAQLGEANPQQMSDCFPAVILGNGQDGSEALVDTPIKGFFAASVEFPPLLGGQDNRFHGRRWGLGNESLRLLSLSMVTCGLGSVPPRPKCIEHQALRCDRHRAIRPVG